MAKEILVHAGLAERRIAVLEDGVLTRLIEAPVETGSARPGDIVSGRVVRIVPAVDAAFVAIGGERPGFLPAREAPGAHGTPIAERVREGEAVLVQIAGEEDDDKGARLSTRLRLPGRYLVFAPEDKVAVSRRIADVDERARLIALGEALRTGADAPVPGAGYIFRSAAASAAEDAVYAEAARLAALWRTIEAATRTATPPTTLHREDDRMAVALRDHADAARVIVDDAALAADLRAHTKVPVDVRPPPLFEAFGLAEEIAMLDDTRVALPSGGWIAIEPTAAFIAIDVNAGAHGAGARATVAEAVNREAAEQIARQIVLRGLGGQIVIDFIDAAPAHLAALGETMRARLASDGGAEIGVLAPFGLVAIRRRRPRDRPVRRGIADTARAVLRAVEQHGAAAPGAPVLVRCAPDIAAWLAAREEMLAAGRARLGVPSMRVIAEPARPRASFAVETDKDVP